MKKIILAMALLASSLCAGAFEFDGIDLNSPYANVTREIAKKGYTYNHDRNCLQGNCQGVDIFVSINYLDVIKEGMLGQLIVEVPAGGDVKTMYNDVSVILNIIYHQIAKDEETVTYLVDNDGTKLILGEKNGYLILTYNTPFYSVKRSK
ncbi:MAG: hypothetical protein MJY62_01720 [Bacteroidales bacterium]|nr:hypothetical protein [Bacteroidales bacterium]